MSTLESLNQVMNKLDAVQNILSLSREVANSIQRIFNTIDAVVYLKTESDTFLQVGVCENKQLSNGQVASPMALSFGQGIVGTAAEYKKTIRVSDTRTTSVYIIDDEERLSELAVPIIFKGDVIGIIDTEHHERGFFTSQHQLFMESLANAISPRLVIMMLQTNSISSTAFSQIKPIISEHGKLLIDDSESSQSMNFEAFFRAFSTWLKHFHKPKKKLASSLKAWSRQNLCIKIQASELECVNSLDRCILRQLDKMSQQKSQALHVKLLRLSYVDEQYSQQFLASEFHMGYSTVRRHIHYAKQELAYRVWSQQEMMM